MIDDAVLNELERRINSGFATFGDTQALIGMATDTINAQGAAIDQWREEVEDLNLTLEIERNENAILNDDLDAAYNDFDDMCKTAERYRLAWTNAYRRANEQRDVSRSLYKIAKEQSDWIDVASKVLNRAETNDDDELGPLGWV